MWSAGMFSCLICVNTIHTGTKSSPAECSLIIGRLVFISALIHKHQVHRRILMHHLVYPDLQQHNRKLGNYVLFQSFKNKFRVFSLWDAAHIVTRKRHEIPPLVT